MVGRGSAAGQSQGFAAAIWEMVRRVPAGRATTYGQLAEAWYGVARGARQAGQAMAHCPDGLPWWRVVHADGGMKGGPGSEEQLDRLADEGVPITPGAGRLGQMWGPVVPGAAIDAKTTSPAVTFPEPPVEVQSLSTSSGYSVVGTAQA
jgi:alkylated DNA nucleotide flippase Atl1